MGSVFVFNKIVKREGCRVLLDNGEYVSFRKGRYFQNVKGWERINYEVFEDEEACRKYIKKNYKNFKDLNCEKELDKILNQFN